jgi:hypothetical protein
MERSHLHKTVELLEAKQPDRRIATMNATLGVYNPLYDRLVDLWLATTTSEPTQLVGSAQGLDRPCMFWPVDWAERRADWIEDYHAALRIHGPVGRHHRSNGTFQNLLRWLKKCPGPGNQLTARDMNSLYEMLVRHVDRHGFPSSPERHSLRQRQRVEAARPLHAAIAHACAARIRETGRPLSEQDLTEIMSALRRGRT